MSVRRTALLAAIFAALALHFAIFERSAPSQPSASERPEPLVDCAAGEPSRIAVTSSRGTLAAERAGERWSAPGSHFAAVAAASLAEALCRIPIADRIAEARPPGEFGLEDGALEVAVEAGGRTHRLRIGRATPAGNQVYVSRAGERAILVAGVELAHVAGRLAGHAAAAAR